MAAPLHNIIDLSSDDGNSDSDDRNSDSDSDISDDSVETTSDIRAEARELTRSSDAKQLVKSLRTTLDWFYQGDLGTFTHSAPISDAVFKDPQIHVDGIGTIPVPLSAEHAEKIVALSENGILKPSAVRFGNVLWEQRVLPRIVDEAVKELGVGGKPDAIGAQLREMQLCTKDTGVGPLSIGGDVHVKLAWDEKKLQSSQQQPSFMCWFALTHRLSMLLR
ncbi:hypothetical protein SLS58_001889 [Diplodia intermedia]|uniref:Uncharacterized protein n=1 Tax=Diplodia intermedia TaxID=856260 RepID=A0ABR3U0J5_9PEZI